MNNPTIMEFDKRTVTLDRHRLKADLRLDCIGLVHIAPHWS
ncbi:MAG: hypothetical protein OS112_06000 [Methanoregula sp.]|nr:MAG: hypothetical protein OS112_06000 [Methanoregula sp.]